LEDANDIAGLAEARLVRFCTQVGYVKSKHTEIVPDWPILCRVGR